MATRYIVGCGAVVRNKDGKYLMVKQMNGYWRSKWIFPGGKLELGETLEDCARRELIEETGCDFEISRQIGAYVSYDPATEHEKQVVLVYYLGNYTCGELRIGDGVTEVGWFYFDEIENMTAEGKVPKIIFQVALDSIHK
ncbi:NUDIX hydrolase [Methanocella sp. CWC-04]|uniref:NUDIX hydrolase n=1 Tax=Methanooceanicella nereidis TaxID=2052831 RepID=A0AAP2W5A6_9EURY|nr:NUDIX domain-containing protein [Methanocella sp. CWC-04]MCD1293982.1 NUDIX hydrolase [Methanocella sp. CWC-04]